VLQITRRGYYILPFVVGAEKGTSGISGISGTIPRFGGRSSSTATINTSLTEMHDNPELAYRRRAAELYFQEIGSEQITSHHITSDQIKVRFISASINTNNQIMDRIS